MDDGLSGFQEGTEQVLVVSDGDGRGAGQRLAGLEDVINFLVRECSVLVLLVLEVDLESDGGDVSGFSDLLRDVQREFGRKLDVLVHRGNLRWQVYKLMSSSTGQWSDP